MKDEFSTESERIKPEMYFRKERNHGVVCGRKLAVSHFELHHLMERLI